MYTDVPESRFITCHRFVLPESLALIVVLYALYKPFRAFDVVHRILTFTPVSSDEFQISADPLYIILPALFEHLLIKPAVILFHIVESLFKIYVYVCAELESLFRI